MRQSTDTQNLSVPAPEVSKRLVLKIEEHLQQRGHPVRLILDLFQDIFTRQYAEYIENESAGNKAIIEKIQSLGRDFTLNIFKSVNEFVTAIFETLLTFYDPEIEGFLEDAERDLDKIALTRTVFGQTYFVLLVLSRVMNKDKDKDLRFKA